MLEEIQPTAADNEEALFASFEKLADFVSLQTQLLDRLGELESDSERQQQVDTLLVKIKNIVRMPIFHTRSVNQSSALSSTGTKSKLIL